MTAAASLSSVLRRARPALLDDDLERKLRAALADARAIWPAIDVDDATFVAYLSERLPEKPQAAVGALDRVAFSDLYLACGCALGKAVAIGCFDRDYLARLAPIVARFNRGADFVEEVRQQLRIRLLVGPSPRIADYSGSGPLATWVRVAASREALNQVRGSGRRERLALLSAPPAPSTDPETAALKEQFRPELERALRAAFTQLDDEQRNLLRRHYVDGESLDHIARSRAVDRSTVSRWVASARRLLLTETSRELQRLVPALTPSSRDSLMLALRSRVNITLESVLRL